MKLNPRSWHAELYCNAYGKDYDQLPNNLCPYFWKLIIILVLLPITWPVALFNRIEGRSYSGYATMGMPLFIAVLFSFAGLPAGVPILINFHLPPDQRFDDLYHRFGALAPIVCVEIGYMAIIFMLAIIILNIKLIAFIIKSLPKNPQKKVYPQPLSWDPPAPKKTHKPNILIEFIKAKYNNYCPKIDWQEKQNP